MPPTLLDILSFNHSGEIIMTLKSIAALAAAVIAGSAWAGAPAEQKCGTSTCGKKETPCKPGDKCDGKEASCSKKDAACAKK